MSIAVSTVLNACGRMNNPMLGVNACLGNSEAKKECEQILSDYKKELGFLSDLHVQILASVQTCNHSSHPYITYGILTTINHYCW